MKMITITIKSKIRVSLLQKLKINRKVLITLSKKLITNHRIIFKIKNQEMIKFLQMSKFQS